MAFLIDPDAVKDYRFDWSPWLDVADTITSHTVTPSAGITVDSHTADTTSVTVWLSGATGKQATVTCHIATSQGRQDDRTLYLRVVNR